MFTVTPTAPDEPSSSTPLTTSRRRTRSRSTDSRALVVSRSSEQVVYAPGAWLRMHQSTDNSSETSGNTSRTVPAPAGWRPVAYHSRPTSGHRLPDGGGQDLAGNDDPPHNTSVGSTSLSTGEQPPSADIAFP